MLQTPLFYLERSKPGHYVRLTRSTNLRAIGPDTRPVVGQGNGPCSVLAFPGVFAAGPKFA